MNELENVKVGDKLLVRNNIYWEDIEIVERVTKTLVITKRHKFNIKDGFSAPKSTWIKIYARPATPEDIKRNIREKNIRTCRDTNYDKLTDSQLERIVNIINNKD